MMDITNIIIYLDYYIKVLTGLMNQVLGMLGLGQLAE